MNNTPSPKKIYLAFGLGEGRIVARKFEYAATQRGFELTSNHNEADVVIGHSAGCYTLAHLLNTKTIILIGPPTQISTTRDLMRAVSRKLRREYQELSLREFLAKNALNALYLVNVPRAFHLRKFTLKRRLPEQTMTLIRNQHDDFTDKLIQLHQSDGIRYLSMPGGHDDLWQNPSRYLDILERTHD